ncbi:hypothetical protein RRG08_066433 [Elysia crispata]|uniref:Uncharacterized protein n=1 Tax=Elysia crispata TaxID=231223 RepID=A0AAE0Z819_9GAST|nr:hypothetical protein RRG08_066433 [Elysia crispata]
MLRRKWGKLSQKRRFYDMCKISLECDPMERGKAQSGELLMDSMTLMVNLSLFRALACARGQGVKGSTSCVSKTRLEPLKENAYISKGRSVSHKATTVLN